MVARLRATRKPGAWTTSLTVSITTRSEQDWITGESEHCCTNPRWNNRCCCRYWGMRRTLLDNQRTRILSLLVLCRLHSGWYCHAPSLPPALCVVWQEGLQRLSNSQHFIKRSWREGESLLWKTPFHNIISRLVRLTTNQMNLHQFVKKLPFVKEEKGAKDLKEGFI